MTTNHEPIMILELEIPDEASTLNNCLDSFIASRNIDPVSSYGDFIAISDIVDEKTTLESRVERFNEIKNIFKKNYELNTNDRNEFDQNEYVLIIKDMINLDFCCVQ